MKLKKFLSMALAFAMALSLAIPAFAARDNGILAGTDKDGTDFAYSKSGWSTWQDVIFLGDTTEENTDEEVSAWHLVVTAGASVDDATEMHLIFENGSTYDWREGGLISANHAGNNRGWMIVAPKSWGAIIAGTMLPTKGNFNISGYYKAGTPKPGDPTGKVSAVFSVNKLVVGDTNLAGFKFGIFDNAACTGTALGTMTSDAAGDASTTVELAPGTYYVTEIDEDLTKYEDNTQVLTATVVEGRTDAIFATDTDGLELKTFTNYYKLGKLNVTGSVTKIWDKEIHKLVYQTYSEGTLVSHIAPESGANLPEGVTGSYLKNGMTYLNIDKAKLAAAGEDGVTIGIAQSDPHKGNKTSWNTPAPAPKGEDDQPTYNLKIVDGKLVVTSELPNIGVRLYTAKENPKGPSDFKGKYATKGHLTGETTATFDIPKGDTFKLFVHIEDTEYKTNAVIGCEFSMIGQGMENVSKDVYVEVSRVIEDDIALVGTYSLLDFKTLEDLEADTYTVTLIYNGEVLATMACVVTAGQTATADFGSVIVTGEKEIVCPYVDNLGGPDHGIFPDYPLYETMPIAD